VKGRFYKQKNNSSDIEYYAEQNFSNIVILWALYKHINSGSQFHHCKHQLQLFSTKNIMLMTSRASYSPSCPVRHGM